MKTIHKSIELPAKSISKENYIVIDIETTGLGYKNKIIIIGLFIIEEYKTQATFLQFFNDDGLSEKEILFAFIENILKFKKYYFISYNGNAFDFSFINARLNFHHLNFQLSKSNNVDLLAIARSHKSKFPFQSLNLKSIESFYSIIRKDAISGKESIDLYNAYILDPSHRLEDLILTHNEDDILNLWPLFSNMKSHLKFPLPACFIWDEQYYYIQALFTYTNYLDVSFSLALIEKLKDCFLNQFGVTLTTNSKQYNLRLSITQIYQKTLFIFDTEKIFDLNFDLLDNQSKQKYIVKYGDQIYMDNILQTIVTVLNKISQ